MARRQPPRDDRTVLRCVASTFSWRAGWRYDQFEMEGNGEVTIATVAGKQHATLQVARKGDSFSGIAKANGEDMAMKKLVVDGNHAT